MNKLNTSLNSSHGELCAAGNISYVDWQTHMAVGRMAYERGLYAAAIRNYRCALKMSGQLELGPAELVENLLGLATSDCKTGLASGTDDIYKRVLEIEERISAIEYDDLATHLNCLAVIYRQIDRLSEAEATLQKALKIAERQRISSPATIATIVKNLAQVFFEKGELSTAQKYITNALSICDTRSSHQTMLFAEILVTMTMIAARQGRYEEARQLIEQAIEVVELLTGGMHPDLADLLELAADMVEEDGDAEGANSLTGRVASIRRRLREIDR